MDTKKIKIIFGMVIIISLLFLSISNINTSENREGILWFNYCVNKNIDDYKVCNENITCMLNLLSETRKMCGEKHNYTIKKLKD